MCMHMYMYMFVVVTEPNPKGPIMANMRIPYGGVAISHT